MYAPLMPSPLMNRSDKEDKMKQQIIVSGTGGQGTLFLTRLLAEAALENGLPVLTSETHGMAMRGGTVVSHIKIGSFQSPLISQGRADAGLFLSASNLDIHGKFVKSGGNVFVNADRSGDYASIDATTIARESGSLLVTNLVLLGYAIQSGLMFCDADIMRQVIERISPQGQVDTNAKGFELGLNYNGQG